MNLSRIESRPTGVGLFGVISQLTAQRTRDSGVRIALGAQRRDILNMVLGEGLRLSLAGIGWALGSHYERFHRAFDIALDSSPIGDWDGAERALARYHAGAGWATFLLRHRVARLLHCMRRWIAPANAGRYRQ